MADQNDTNISGVGSLLLSFGRSPLSDIHNSANRAGPSPIDKGTPKAFNRHARGTPAQPTRSVLRRRPTSATFTDHAAATPAPNICFAASTKSHDAPLYSSPVSSTKSDNSSVLRSPRPPRWPVARSPWASAPRAGSKSRNRTPITTPLTSSSAGTVDRGTAESTDDFLSKRKRGSSSTGSRSAAGDSAFVGSQADTSADIQAVHNELLALRVSYMNMCGLVFLAVLGALLYVQGMMVTRYMRSLVIALFASQCLRGPVQCVSKLLRSAGKLTLCTPPWLCPPLSYPCCRTLPAAGLSVVNSSSE